MDEIRHCIKELQDSALKNGCFDNQDKYLDMLLQVEEQDKKQGYLERVKSYRDLKESNRIIRDCQK